MGNPESGNHAPVDATSVFDVLAKGSLSAEIADDEELAAVGGEEGDASHTEEVGEATEVEANAEGEESTTAEDDTEETDSAEGSDEGDEQGEPDTVIVKIDGKAVEVPLEEALNGYTRLNDYHRNMQKLSDERVAFEGEAKAVREERAMLSDGLARLRAELDGFKQQQEPSQEQWDALMHEDPAQYLIKRDQWNQLMQKRENVLAAQREVHAKEKTEKEASRFQQAKAGAEKLKEWIPELKDPNRGQATWNALTKYAKEAFQFTDEQINSTTDPRYILLIHKARKYDEAREQGKKLTRSGNREERAEVREVRTEPRKSIPNSPSRNPGTRRAAKPTPQSIFDSLAAKQN